MFDFIKDDSYEHCGLFIGTPVLDHSVPRVPKLQHIVELPNRADSPELKYRIMSRDVDEALARLKRTQRSLVGFWHTHPPDALSGPSQADLDSIALGSKHWWHAVVHLSSNTLTWYDYFDNIIVKEISQ